jgi:manganese efflux pump family protein
MIAVFFLALALSMDACAVSISLGAKHSINPKKLAFMAAFYFGLFQGLMPLIGYFAGKGILGWVEAYANWLAFFLLLIIGAKMMHESFSEGIEKELKNITHRVMLLLAIATSIDALAAGVALSLLQVHPLLSCFIIAITTSAFSYVGVLIGAKSGNKLESKATFFGGIVLILIGFKILLF